MNRISIIAPCIALAACVGGGVKVTEEQAARFKPGESTYQDVVKALGKPTTVTVLSDGSRTAIYSYAYVQARPASFIPYIGPLVAGADTTASSVVFVFDRDNLLVKHAASETNIGAGANLTAGPSQPGSPSQPRVAE